MMTVRSLSQYLSNRWNQNFIASTIHGNLNHIHKELLTYKLKLVTKLLVTR